MKYATVCSGVEAPTLAWQSLGWQAEWLSEIEPFPSALLGHYYEAPNLGDMTELESRDDLGSIDLLFGGTPCQSFSVAGLRGGMADARGNLALVFCRLVAKLRPAWVVWENVPGVLSSNRGRDFGAILGAMAELGYGFAYRVLDAQYFGVPQRRRRVFLVCHLGDWRRAAEVLFEPESLRRNPAPRREPGQEVTGTVSARTKGGGGLGTDFDLAGGIQQVTHSLRGEGFDASEGGTGRGTPIIPHCELYNAEGSEGATLTKSNLSKTVNNQTPLLCFDETQITHPENRSSARGDTAALAAGARPPTIAFSGKDYGADASEECAPTLRAMGHADSHMNGGGQVAVANAAAVRRLTPRECERLMGFPDDYTLVPYRGKTASDSVRYKAIGNSIAVPCLEWIGKRIAATTGGQA